MALNTQKMAMKIAIMTIGSFGFGAVMAMFMSSFEFNSTMAIDTNRSTTSQLK